MKLILQLLFICLLTSCYYDNEEELYPNAPECDTTVVTFSVDVQPIISASCAISGCHVAGGTGSGNFQTYSGIKSKVDVGSFMNRVIVQQNMPPNGDLSSCELEQLKIWIDEGAPNN
ncbi:MAG: hypothetical protein RJQ00_00225 [Vicingaceae bacterium]